MKKILKKNGRYFVLQIAITVFFIYFTFRNINFAAFATAIRNVNYVTLTFTLVPLLFSILFLAAREKVLLNRLYSFRFVDLLKGVLINVVGNNILPLRAGEFLKVFYWAKRSKKSYVSLLSIAFLERVFDLLLVFILFLSSSHAIIAQFGVSVKLIIAIVSTFTLPIAILIFLDLKYKQQFNLHRYIQPFLGEKISHFIHEFLHKIMFGIRILHSVSAIFWAFFFTILYWFANFATIYIVLRAFHLPLSWQAGVVILWATSFGTAIPAAPGYIGTFDYFAKMALVLYGINVSMAASFAVVLHIISIIPLTLIGLLFIYPILNQLRKME